MTSKTKKAAKAAPARSKKATAAPPRARAKAPARKPARAKAARPARAKSAPTRAKRPGRTLSLERFIPATPERVYELWTSAKGLGLWIASSADLDRRVGGRADIVMVMEGEHHKTKNRFLALEPGRRVELEWERTAQWGPTHVAVTFEPEREGTRLRLVQSGFGDGPEWDEWYENFDAGWAHLLARLATAAEAGGSRDATLTENVDAPPSQVWKAISSPEGLARWFTSGKGKLEHRSGGRYGLTCGPVAIEGEVRDWDKDRTLAFTWSVEPCTQKALALPTVVTLHLTPLAAGGTRVSLVHSGFGDGPEWDEIYARHAATWKFLLENLRTVVSLGVDQRGRSIERSLFVRAQPARVYDLFATKKGVESWFAPEAQVTGEVGSPYVLHFKGPRPSPAKVRGRVVAAVPGERFAYVWPSHGSKERPTLVTVNLAAEAGGTRITLVESGFGRGAEWDADYLDHCQGWGIELNKILAVVEGLGERGRAVVVNRSFAASPEQVWAALGERALGTALDLRPQARSGFAIEWQGLAVSGDVREVVPGQALALSWTAGGSLPSPTFVAFLLAPLRDGGTQLTLAHSGFGQGEEWDRSHDSHAAGWSSRFDGLAEGLGKTS